MAITVQEKFGSGRWATSAAASGELIYTIIGTADEAEALAALNDTAPGIHNGLYRQSRTVEPVGNDLWIGICRYGRPRDRWQEQDEEYYSFDTGGGMHQITQSIQTVGKYAPSGKTPPDFKGAIGVTHDSVEGVQITLPTYRFAETHVFDDGQVTETYKGQLFQLTGKVNNTAFRGLAIGEVLFLGAMGTRRGEEDWAITFNFAGSANMTNIQVGDILVPSKKGWEYLWVRYAEAVDDQAKTLIKKPVAAYVEQVYHYGNFALLGI